jgi:hypothetical protein
MKKGLLKMLFGVILSVVLIMTLGASVVSANGGGMPAAHGMTGEEFGAAVSSLAQSAPGAVADHVCP